MSRAGQWGCETCATKYGHADLWAARPYVYDKGIGWCGVSNHRVNTLLVWLPDVEPAVPIRRYVFPADAAAAPTQSAAAEAARPPARAGDGPFGQPPTKQLELF